MKKDMTFRDVFEFAKLQGCDGVLKMPYKYKGMKVYEPYFYGKGIPCVGFPLVILVKFNHARMSTADESLEVMDLHSYYCHKDREFAHWYKKVTR